MKIIPKPYYKCDYCSTTLYCPDFKYIDNSGLNNQTYDICSDACLEKHISFLKRTYELKLDAYNFDFSGTIEEHIAEFVRKKY